MKLARLRLRLGRARADAGAAGLLAAARADALAARRLDSSLAPAPELFPPALRALWRDAGE